MNPVILGTLVADENGDGSVLDDLGMVGSISGTVTLDEAVTIPDCPTGSGHSILDFVPTATINGLLDGEGQPIVRTGTVAEGGAFQIGFLPSGTYTLGYVSSVEFYSNQLAFAAEVTPTEVSVADVDVPGVAYTITSAACEGS
jgi:hypothetical protein